MAGQRDRRELMRAFAAFGTGKIFEGRPEEKSMSTSKISHLAALTLVAAIAASGTSVAWAKSANPHEERGWKTYLPGEGGCNEQHIFWVQPCGD
jgi:hypothetical protein